MKHTTRMSAMFFFFLFLSVLWADESHSVQIGKDPQDRLTFVWSEEIVHYPISVDISDIEAPMPAYVAQLYVTGCKSQECLLILKKGASQFATKQQTLMDTRPFVQVVSTEGTAYEGYDLIRLYAINRKQAGKMAYVVIDTLTQRAQQQQAQLERDKRQLHKKLRLANTEQGHASEQLESLQGRFTDLLGSEHYQGQTARDAAELAQQRIVELTAQSDLVRAQLAESHTVIESVKERLGQLKTEVAAEDRDSLLDLKTLTAEHQARWEGLEARQRVLNQALVQEKWLRGLYQQIQALQQEKDQLAQDQIQYRERLDFLETRTAQTDPDLCVPRSSRIASRSVR